MNSSNSGNHKLEGLSGLICGFAYGFSNAFIGQPFDSLKTKMQAELRYMNTSMFITLKNIIKYEGILGLYHGLLPPLIGSSIFRSIQFGTYKYCHSHIGEAIPISKNYIPFTNGLEYRVLLAAIGAGTARSFIETPLELIKVRQMTNLPWNINILFHGFSSVWLRSCTLLMAFFGLADITTREFPQWSAHPFIGPLLKGGFCSTIAWALIWPFEVAKNQVQAKKDITPLKQMIKNGRSGISTLYRGFLPGCMRSMIASTFAMIIFDACQKNAKFRDD